MVSAQQHSAAALPYEWEGDSTTPQRQQRQHHKTGHVGGVAVAARPLLLPHQLVHVSHMMMSVQAPHAASTAGQLATALHDTTQVLRPPQQQRQQGPPAPAAASSGVAGVVCTTA